MIEQLMAFIDKTDSDTKDSVLKPRDEKSPTNSVEECD